MGLSFADLVQDTSTSTGTGAIVLSGVPAAGFQALAAVGPVGSTFPYNIRNTATAEWESGTGTITATNTFTRVPSASSNSGALVNFSAGTKTVMCTLTAAQVARIPIDRDVAFSQSVPLDQVGIAWMAQQSVTSKFTFTPAASAVKGAVCTGYIVADGVTANAPDTSAFKTPVGSPAYNNVAGAMNQFEASFDGVNKWWCWNQSGSTGGTADTAPPTMNGSLASSNITTTGFTLTWSAATDNIAVTGYEVSTDNSATFTDIGNVTTWNATGKTAGTAYPCAVRAYDAAGNRASPALTLTVTTSASADTTPPTMNGAITSSNVTQTSYTLSWSAGSDNVGVTGYEYSLDGGTTYTDVGTALSVNVTGRTAGAVDQVRVRDYDAAGNRGTPLSATVTLASVTVPDAPTIGTATAGDTTATVTWTAPASNGGSAITGYTVTSTPGSFTATAAAGATSATVTGLTNGTAYTFTVHATNAVGNSAESAASNSVTPAAIDWPRLTSLSTTTTESGTGPYTYTGGGTALSSEKGGLTTKSLPANVDGWLQFKILNASAEVEVGFRNVQSTNIYSSQLSGFYSTTGSGAVPAAYRHVSSSNLATVPAAGDEMRVGRVGGNWKTWVLRSGTWTEIDSWAGSTVQIWFDVVCAGTSSIQLTGWSGFV